jgi:hypothetical protein
MNNLMEKTLRSFRQSPARWRRLALPFLASLVLWMQSVPSKASVASEALERLVQVSGKTLEPLAHVEARKTLEAGLARYGEGALVAAQKGGLDLVEAAASHGGEVWKLARLCEGAPEALAARPEKILYAASKWGEDAARLEIKAPGCGEILAQRLGALELEKIAAEGTPAAIKRLAVLAAHGSPEEVRLAAGLWGGGSTGILERLSPARVAAVGFSTAAIIAAFQTPKEALHFLESALTSTLGATLTVVSWGLLLFFLALLCLPLVWAARRRLRRANARGKGLPAPLLLN